MRDETASVVHCPTPKIRLRRPRTRKLGKTQRAHYETILTVKCLSLSYDEGVELQVELILSCQVCDIRQMHHPHRHPLLRRS